MAGLIYRINKGSLCLNIFLFVHSHWTIKTIRNNHFSQRYVVVHPRELYIKLILTAFFNLCFVWEFYYVVVVWEICYFDSSTCEMDTHFHFLMHVLSVRGWVQSYAFYDLIDLAVLTVFSVSKEITISSFIFIFFINQPNDELRWTFCCFLMKGKAKGVVCVIVKHILRVHRAHIFSILNAFRIQLIVLIPWYHCSRSRII